MSFQSIFTKYILNIWFFSIVITVLTLSLVGKPISPGLDASYIFAANYFLQNDIQMGKDIIFVFGPLGFLAPPQPQGNNLLVATIVALLLKFLFSYSSLRLYILAKKKVTVYHWMYAVITVYILASIVDIHSMLIFIPLILILIYFYENSILWLIIASTVVAVALLVKSSIGIIAILFFMSFSLYLIFNKEYKILFTIWMTTIITFLSIWFLLYQNLDGIYNYFYGILELSKGNSSAMTSNMDNNWVLFSSFLLVLFAFPFFKKEKVLYLLYGVSLLSIAAFFKYAIAREDHIFNFEVFLLIYLIIVFIATQKTSFKDFFFFFGAYLLFLSFIYVTPNKLGIERSVKRHISSLKIDSFVDIMNIDNRFLALEKRSISYTRQAKLDKETINLIGNSTVDTYPWETSYIYANSLKWRPRPVFQSYITYTSFLDNLNAEFYRSGKAPEFIIWQLNHGAGEAKSIDGRYLLNDNPLTLYEILNNYRVVLDKQVYLILKRNKPKLDSEILFKKSYKWDEWITVPEATKNNGSSFLLAKTDIKRSFMQKVKKLIFKEFAVYVNYKLISGEVIRHRLVVDTAKNGIWVNPLLHTLFDFDFADDVMAIKLTHDKYDFFDKSFNIEWNMVTLKSSLSPDTSNIYMSPINMKIGKEDDAIQFTIDELTDGRKGVRIHGWAFRKNKTIDKSIKYIAFISDEKTYVFPVKQTERKDITKHFQAENLDSSGFGIAINKNGLKVGVYKLYILLEEPNGSLHMSTLNSQIVVTK